MYRVQNMRRELPEKVHHLKIRKADIGLLAGCILAGLFLFMVIGIPRQNGSNVEIRQDGSLYAVYPLAEDRDITVGTNVVSIREGSVRMTSADCPDQICVRSAAITKTGESIICLPHRLVVRITGADTTDGVYDTVTE